MTDPVAIRIRVALREGGSRPAAGLSKTPRSRTAAAGSASPTAKPSGPRFGDSSPRWRGGEFGRAVIEALAVGLPAVLPPAFRETFGEAALYAEPAEVRDRIAALWAELAQAWRRREFVMANSDWSQFPDRLARTVAAAAATTGSEIYA